MTYTLAGKRVFVAGHRGMVGSALLRRLQSENCELLTVSRDVVDLRDQKAVSDWIGRNKPQAIFLAAAKVGGILANDRYPADFLSDNLAVQSNVIDAAFRHGVEKLMFLGSSCIYPKHAAQPIPETALMTGPLEPTNEWYAIAKIAGLKLCQAYRRQHGADFISVMPTNLYGPGDNYHPENSHVIPALIRKAHEAKLAKAPAMTIWGTGSALREFMHVDDAADAMVHVMKVYSGDSHVNIGTGTDLSILQLAHKVAKAVGFGGAIATDPSKPDGTPRKLMDGAMLSGMGWAASIPLETGLLHAYEAFLAASRSGLRE
jgi:GDP-L-fucose synthase